MRSGPPQVGAEDNLARAAGPARLSGGLRLVWGALPPRNDGSQGTRRLRRRSSALTAVGCCGVCHNTPLVWGALPPRNDGSQGTRRLRRRSSALTAVGCCGVCHNTPPAAAEESGRACFAGLRALRIIPLHEASAFQLVQLVD